MTTLNLLQNVAKRHANSCSSSHATSVTGATPLLRRTPSWSGFGHQGAGLRSSCPVTLATWAYLRRQLPCWTSSASLWSTQSSGGHGSCDLHEAVHRAFSQPSNGHFCFCLPTNKQLLHWLSPPVVNCNWIAEIWYVGNNSIDPPLASFRTETT